MDQEMLRKQRASDVTRARWASGQHSARADGRHRAYVDVLSKNPTLSIDAYLLVRTIMPNIIPIRFDTTTRLRLFSARQYIGLC